MCSMDCTVVLQHADKSVCIKKTVRRQKLKTEELVKVTLSRTLYNACHFKDCESIPQFDMGFSLINVY